MVRHIFISIHNSNLLIVEVDENFHIHTLQQTGTSIEKEVSDRMIGSQICYVDNALISADEYIKDVLGDNSFF